MFYICISYCPVERCYCDIVCKVMPVAFRASERSNIDEFI